jgi:NADH:ubiquinone oxidoreductase subunit 2 (subunit N)
MWAELTIGFGIILQFLSLLIFSDKRGQKLQQAIFFAAMILALSASFAQMIGLLPIISPYPNFLLPKALAAFPLAAALLCFVVLAIWVLQSTQIHSGRRSETLLLFSFLSLLLGLLFSSEHVLASFLLLLAIAWTGLFLTGLSFSGRLEGEGLVKFWAQLGFGLGAGLSLFALVIFLSGGGSWSQISSASGLTGPGGVAHGLLIGAIYLPYFVVAGIFPFHLAAADRDEGAPWIIQVALSCIVQGAVLYAAWLVGVKVFHQEGDIATGMRVLQVATLAGAIWHLSLGLYQKNSKRAFSSIAGGAICLMISAAALPTQHSAAALSYAVAINLLWLTLLGFVWGRVQERVGGGDLAAVRGEAKRSRWDGIALLVAISVPLFLPYLPGFSLGAQQLGAILEQRSLLSLAIHFLLLVLQLVFSIRIVTELLFSESAALRSQKSPHPSLLERGGMTLLGLGLLLSGLVSGGIFELLQGAAMAFLK